MVLDPVQSVDFFQGRRSGEQSENVIADPTRHIIRDINLLDEVTNASILTQVSYAAVPIRSVSGQVLGIYSVLDDKTRNDVLDHETYSVLSDIAVAISRYLESQHIQLERDHDTLARLNLSKFLEHNRPRRPRHLDTPRRLSSLSDYGTQRSRKTLRSGSSTSSSSASASTSLDESVFSAASTPFITPAEECSAFSIDPPSMPTLDKASVLESTRTSKGPGDRVPRQSLSVAADLIRAAHDLEGLVLLDATFSNDHDPSQAIYGATDEQSTRCKKLESSIVSENHTSTRITSTMFVYHESLSLLISHFPQGCILKVGQEEEVSALVLTDTPSSGPALYERLDETIVIPSDLQQLLDRAGSLVFMPLWDSARQAFYAAILGWAGDPLRVFTEHDLLSLSIYGRILTAEITRLGMYADFLPIQNALADTPQCRCH